MSSFNTERLKQLVGYAIKGAGFNKLLELSNLIGIKVEGGVLYLNTTDGTNDLKVSDRCVADNFNVTVNADLFAKIISKITTDTVDLEVTSNSLVVTGNGKYVLEIVPNENGEPLSFPDKFPTGVEEVIGTISAGDIVAIETTIKPSLSTAVGSLYANYYFGEFVASTDRAMMGIFSRKLVDAPLMLNKEFVDLMVMSGADVSIIKSDNMLVAESGLADFCTISVCTRVSDGVKDFNVEAINKFLQIEVNSFCRFRKAEMLDLLDRLSLFVSKFDDGAITIHFTADAIEVSSLKSNGIESVATTESKDAQDVTIKINIDRLRNQLKAYSSDMVDLYYGSDVCIKLVDGDMTQIIALIK